MHRRRLRAAGVLMAAGGWLAGCQSYEPHPLDPVAHRQAWLARSAADADVADFADRLERDDAASTIFDLTDGLDRPEAELVALVYNPELRLTRLRAGIAGVTAEHAGRWTDPESGVDVLRITESVSDPWVIASGLTLTIPISGRLEVERERADTAHAVALLRVAEAEWRIRRDVRRAWAGWSHAALRVTETERLVDSMTPLVESTTRLAAAGEMPRPEAALFAIEQSRRRQQLLRDRGEAAATQQELRMLLGLSPQAPLRMNPSLAATNDTSATKRPGDLDSPTLRRVRAEYDLAEHTLHREIRKQYPDLTIGPQYESDEGQSRVGFLGAIPLPILNANTQGIAEARAERALARASVETAWEQLVGARAVAMARLAAIEEEHDTLVTVVAPMVDGQVADALRLLEFGEGGGLVLLESMVRAHETKMQLLAVRRDRTLAATTLAFLAGPPARSSDHPTATHEPEDQE
ncbi:MAG: TolC family protein [Phycisphaerales bacterium]|nr:TolC family protein [Phycisphaerales bacterium]